MRKLTLISFILLSLVLAACQSTTPTVDVDSTAKVADTQPAADTPTQAEVSEPTATKGVEVAPDSGALVRTRCTVESRDPTPGPTEQSLFEPVTESDWIRGPDSAAVTIIEYSDFQ